MEEFDLDNITPEMVLENMKKNGEIDEESYTEVKSPPKEFRFLFS